MCGRNLARSAVAFVAAHEIKQFADEQAWTAHLDRLGLTASLGLTETVVLRTTLRPRRRAILVDVPVSSTNTNRQGSKPGCSSSQARRRAVTSGRSCSAACAVFILKLIP